MTTPNDTPTTDLEVSGNTLPEISVEAAHALQAAAKADYEAAMTAGYRSDLALARAELTLAVLAARAEVTAALVEHELASKDLAAATARLDPVAAEYAEVVGELDAIDLDALEGDLNQRMAMRLRHGALMAELPGIEARTLALMSLRDQAAERVRSAANDTVPMAQENLSAAIDLLVKPPLLDMALLARVAPAAFRQRVFRVGVAAVTLETSRTPHAHAVWAGIRTFSVANGLELINVEHYLGLLERGLQNPSLFQQVKRILLPEVPVDYGPEVKRTADDTGLTTEFSQAGGVPQQGWLPEYGSPEGERMRAQGNTQRSFRPQVGPGQPRVPVMPNRGGPNAPFS